MAGSAFHKASNAHNLKCIAIHIPYYSWMPLYSWHTGAEYVSKERLFQKNCY